MSGLDPASIDLAQVIADHAGGHYCGGHGRWTSLGGEHCLAFRLAAALQDRDADLAAEREKVRRLIDALTYKASDGKRYTSYREDVDLDDEIAAALAGDGRKAEQPQPERMYDEDAHQAKCINVKMRKPCDASRHGDAYLIFEDQR